MSNETMNWYLDRARDERANRYYEIFLKFVRTSIFHGPAALPKKKLLLRKLPASRLSAKKPLPRACL